jgi:hypothetical protein
VKRAGIILRFAAILAAFCCFSLVSYAQGQEHEPSVYALTHAKIFTLARPSRTARS